MTTPTFGWRVALGFLALAAGGRAAGGQEEPLRPRLDQRADTNDWEAYFDHAVAVIRVFPGQADAAFYWASRLDPARAEPLYGRWVTFWLRDLGRFQDYLRENPRVLESAAVRGAETLYLRALQRNPFVAQTLGVLPYDQLPGRWREDLGTRGWLAYARLDFALAAEHLGRQIQRDPEKHVWLRHLRALAFVGLGRYDSASAEMTALAATLRRRDIATPSRIYESKELIEYAIGRLALAQGLLAEARAAFERALAENLGFVPAHAALADLALLRADTATAAREYAQTVEISLDDGWMHYRFGAVLIAMQRPADAAPHLQRAAELEPYYADSYLALGKALQSVGDTAGAVGALQEYIRRAPRRATESLGDARRRLAALTAAHR